MMIKKGASMTKKTKTSSTLETMPSTTATVLPDPFARLGLSDWFDRWPDLFARRWPESFHGIPFVEESFRMEQFVEDDGTIVVRGELPGLDPDEDVTITIDDDRLTIAGEREERHEDKKNGGFRSEFRYGSFERSLVLPPTADPDEVEATYTDGILEVRVPMGEAETTTRKVAIRRR